MQTTLTDIVLPESEFSASSTMTFDWNMKEQSSTSTNQEGMNDKGGNSPSNILTTLSIPP